MQEGSRSRRLTQASLTQEASPTQAHPFALRRHVRSSRSTGCGQHAGLTGAFIVDHEQPTINAAFHYTDGSSLPETTVQLNIAWPVAPVAGCFGDRVGIDGLTVSFTTADGKFSETALPARAWLFSQQGVVDTSRVAVGVMRWGARHGPYALPSTLRADSSYALAFVANLGVGSITHGSIAVGPWADSLQLGLPGQLSVIAVWP